MAAKFAISAIVENKKAQHLPFCQRTPRRADLPWLAGAILADAAEALRIANELMRKQIRDAPFALRFAAPSAQSSTSVGVRLAGLEALPAALAPHPSWVVPLAPGEPGLY